MMALREFTFEVEAEGLSDPRIDDLDDLYQALAEDEAVLGPALAANRRTGSITVVLTVVAADETQGGLIASRSFARALVETGRTQSVARVAAPAAVCA